MFGKNLLEKRIKDVFDKNMDFQSRKVGEFTVFFIEGMVDSGLLSHFVIKPLSQINDIGEAVNSGSIPFCAVSEPKKEKEIF